MIWGDLAPHFVQVPHDDIGAMTEVFASRGERIAVGGAASHEALNNAAARRGDVAGCILHTDRGSQFRARKLHRALEAHRMVGSTGNIGTAADNAAMESFFSLLQKNVLNTRRSATRDELRIAIITWIERTYHRRRRQTALGRLTPTEYETIMTPAVVLAA